MTTVLVLAVLLALVWAARAAARAHHMHDVHRHQVARQMRLVGAAA